MLGHRVVRNDYARRMNDFSSTLVEMLDSTFTFKIDPPLDFSIAINRGLELRDYAIRMYAKLILFYD